jgi:hypothetical protein
MPSTSKKAKCEYKRRLTTAELQSLLEASGEDDVD